MEEKLELVYRSHIQLAGVWGRVKRELEKSQYAVAVGLHAFAKMDDEWLIEPDRLFHMQFSNKVKMPVEEVKSHWKTWVLSGGFRDVAETLSTTLEEIYQILILWSLIPIGSSNGAKVKLEKMRQMEKDIAAFHLKNLPDKFSVLKKFDFVFPVDVESELLSINAARNCLVHRAGIVGERDLDKGTDSFTLKWRALDPFVKDIHGERPLSLPYQSPTEGEAFLALKLGAKEKTFNPGQHLTVSSEEFNWIGWTQLSASQWAASRLEEIARAKGFVIDNPAPSGN